MPSIGLEVVWRWLTPPIAFSMDCFQENGKLCISYCLISSIIPAWSTFKRINQSFRMTDHLFSMTSCQTCPALEWLLWFTKPSSVLSRFRGDSALICFHCQLALLWLPGFNLQPRGLRFARPPAFWITRICSTKVFRSLADGQRLIREVTVK